MNEQKSEITPDQYAFAENALHSLPFARLIGMKLVDLKPDEAVISIEMRDDLRQPSGVFHGGVTGTLIDTAMAFAGRTRFAIDERTGTIDLPVNYLRPHILGKFFWKAKFVRPGKRIFTVSADLVD